MSAATIPALLACQIVIGAGLFFVFRWLAAVEGRLDAIEGLDDRPELYPFDPEIDETA